MAQSQTALIWRRRRTSIVPSYSALLGFVLLAASNASEPFHPTPVAGRPPPTVTSAVPGNDHDAGEFGDAPYSFDGDVYRETVEDRAVAWRRQQQELQQQQTPLEQASATDEQGRMKLFSTSSRFAISAYFFVLMWRALHHYELANQSFKGSTRVVTVLPFAALFVFNMASCAAVWSSNSHSGKKKMKAVLNLNKLAELVLFVYNMYRMTLKPSKYIPHEIYVGRSLSNFIFLMQSQLFTKIAWRDAVLVRESMSEQSMPSYAPDHSSDWQQQHDNKWEKERAKW